MVFQRRSFCRKSSVMDSSGVPFPKRRTQLYLSPSSSLSSSSSSLNFSDNNSPLSPFTPLQFSHRVPFSWEKLPGIPKKQTPLKKKPQHQEDPSSLEPLLLLPLPPPTNNNATSSKRFNDVVRGAGGSNRKSRLGESARMDPFFAAMVECSKEYGERDPLEVPVWKPRNSYSSDVFGLFLNLQGSCKRTCTVSESLVHLPRRRNNNAAVAEANVCRRQRNPPARDP